MRLEPGILATDLCDQGVEALHGKIAARQGLMARPIAADAEGGRQKPSELVERMLGEAPVGRDFAAKYRKHRRAGFIQFQHIIPRGCLRFACAVIVERSDA